jgi:hypothetical protein
MDDGPGILDETILPDQVRSRTLVTAVAAGNFDAQGKKEAD